jgi:nitrogen PTS system EIIA component
MIKFLQYTRPEHILFDMKATAKEEALQEMFDALIGTGDIDPEKAERILGRILKREELGSTGVGTGFAYPHIKSREIEKPYLVIGRSKKGIDWDALDGEPVNFAALALVPLTEEDRAASLFSIEMLMSVKRVRYGQAMQYLLKSQTQEEFWELLEEIDEDIFF